MIITHIFFDLHGTLIDSHSLAACWSGAVGRLMSERYGGEPAAWSAAHDRILADWDSYYADLDLTGEDGLHDYFEGMFRTTRALFRLTHTPEPEQEALWALTHELPEIVTRGCDALFDDARAVIPLLNEMGYALGIATHAPLAQARGTLIGGGIDAWFKAPLCTPDTLEHFDKDDAFYQLAARLAGVESSTCLVVDDRPLALLGARAAGMHTALIIREGEEMADTADVTLRDLRSLPAWLSANADAL